MSIAAVQKGGYHASIEQNTPISLSAEQEQPHDSGRKRLPGESAMWFNRYCLYRDLGHKRSLRAAVAKERETLRVVGKPQKATLKGAGDIQSINVPGSWKHAAKSWAWADRAGAFDAWLLKGMIKGINEHMGDTYANKHKRLNLLDQLIKVTIEQWNATIKAGTTHKIYLSYLNQIAALLKQMHEEMDHVSDDEMQAAITAYGKAIFEEMEKAYHSGETSIERKA